MLVDFHCHSNCSDGELTPRKLIELAQTRNISQLAITDHDSIAAFAQIKDLKTPMQIITGVEFSTTWNKIGVHIVGLNFDLASDSIAHAVKYQQNARKLRAQIISNKLGRIGLHNAYQTLKKCKPHQQIGRGDFANLLVEQGICTSFAQAFKKYLGAGKTGDVKNNWLPLDAIVQAIVKAGGVAIIAHPLYYKLTNCKLKRFIKDFKQAGGGGMEVINGYQNPDKTLYLQQLCQQFELKMSLGSDFHRPTNYSTLGVDTKLLPQFKSLFNS